jgi:hypothetical protein
VPSCPYLTPEGARRDNCRGRKSVNTDPLERESANIPDVAEDRLISELITLELGFLFPQLPKLS